MFRESNSVENTLFPKPSFNEGDKVSFFPSNECSGEGIIRGLSSSGVLDLWIIEILSSNIDKNVYPYSCLTLPHTLITKL